MKRSGGLVIGRSGDRKNKLTAGTRRRGEEMVDLDFSSRINRSRAIIRSTDFSPCLRASVVEVRPLSSPRLRASAVRFCLALVQTLRATLREIFDESAYDRFLLRTSKAHSAASYRDFTRERDAAMAKKPRCC
jgi:hypothetical protein